MARRIRSIKPEMLDDEVVAALPHLEWRLFVSLWLLADDYGNLRGRAAMIRGNALWATLESDDQTEDAIESLVSKGLLAHYSVRGQSYLHICGWTRHQRVDKPGKPAVPAYVEDYCDSRENSREPRESLATDLDLEGIGKEEERPESLAPSPLATPPATPKPRRQPSGEHQETVAVFDAAYREQNGSAPTWDGKTGGIIAALVKQHGGGEVQRRIAILFSGQGPPWVSPPFDVSTLRQHFDKLAQPTQAQNRNRFEPKPQPRKRLDGNG
jgi:hypothetical protein